MRESGQSNQVASIDSRYLKPSLHLFNDDMQGSKIAKAPRVRLPKDSIVDEEIGGYIKVLLNQCAAKRRGGSVAAQVMQGGYERPKYRFYAKKWESPFETKAQEGRA